MLLVSAVTCYYLETGDGRIPAKEFIMSLEPASRRKFFAVRGLLEAFGYALREPYVKYLGQKTFELRWTGREGALRALYFFVESGNVIFTNGFIKKTMQTPEREIAFAVRSREAYLHGRMRGIL